MYTDTHMCVCTMCVVCIVIFLLEATLAVGVCPKNRAFMTLKR